MTSKAYIKPTKPSLIIGIVASVLMFLFAVFFFILLIGEPDAYIGMGFLIFFMIVVLLIGGSFVYNYINYEKNPAMNLAEEIQLENTFLSNNSEISFDEKLRKLDKLKNENLISREEYDKKRQEIMEQKW